MEGDEIFLRATCGYWQHCLAATLRGIISPGPEKDELIERTFQALASNPDIFFEMPVEKAAAEMMHRIYTGC